ncbi:unnamed protein product [Sphagnum troendelagicum]|uniref:Uncharacterized protein n=1 Tax=Sphagnum troendelagicum TaxID=128251 RepID=A0ABP0UUP0_9BRYO
MQCKKILDPDTERRQTSPPGRRSSRSFGSNEQQTLEDKIRTTECPRFMKIQKMRPDCSKMLEIEIEIERDIRQTDRQDNILRDEKEWRIRKAHRVQDPLQRLEKLAALVEMMDQWSSKKPIETAKERNAGSRHQK